MAGLTFVLIIVTTSVNMAVIDRIFSKLYMLNIKNAMRQSVQRQKKVQLYEKELQLIDKATMDEENRELVM